MKLVIEVSPEIGRDLTELGLDESQAAQLVRDALGEFISIRSPVHDYVHHRYHGQGARFLADKIKRVLVRNTWATFLKSGEFTLIKDEP